MTCFMPSARASPAPWAPDTPRPLLWPTCSQSHDLPGEEAEADGRLFPGSPVLPTTFPTDTSTTCKTLVPLDFD